MGFAKIIIYFLSFLITVSQVNLGIDGSLRRKPDPSEVIVSEKQEPDFVVLNLKTKKMHNPWCDSVNDIAESNYAESKEPVEKLEEQGYVKCKKKGDWEDEKAVADAKAKYMERIKVQETEAAENEQSQVSQRGILDLLKSSWLFDLFAGQTSEKNETPEGNEPPIETVVAQPDTGETESSQDDSHENQQESDIQQISKVDAWLQLKETLTNPEDPDSITPGKAAYMQDLGMFTPTSSDRVHDSRLNSMWTTVSALDVKDVLIQIAKHDISFFFSYTGDNTGKWKRATINTYASTQDYIIPYYVEYFNAEDETHVIFNRTMRTETLVSVVGKSLWVRIYHADRISVNAVNVGTGSFLEAYFIDTDTGEVTDISN